MNPPYSISMPFNPQPISLTGRVVRLEPLSLSHVPDLTEVGREESIWRYMLYGTIRSEDDLRAWVQDILERQARGADLAFAVIHRTSGKAVGATRYLDIRPEHRGLEIGGTWYGLAYQRTAVNTECKFLLLQHAFEALGCVRVQFKTDQRNERSQQALERIGARREGVLRNHMILADGTLRHSVYFSILDSEWPSVKALLREKLES